MADALKPSPALLAKLGSIIVHVEEGSDAGGHVFDWHTVKMLTADPEVREWLAGMGKMAMLPVRRDAKRKKDPANV